jgi:hypothetical protein
MSDVHKPMSAAARHATICWLAVLIAAGNYVTLLENAKIAPRYVVSPENIVVTLVSRNGETSIASSSGFWLTNRSLSVMLHRSVQQKKPVLIWLKRLVRAATSSNVLAAEAAIPSRRVMGESSWLVCHPAPLLSVTLPWQKR